MTKGNRATLLLDGATRGIVRRIPLRTSRLVLLFVSAHLVAYFLQLGLPAQLPTALLLYFLCPGLLLIELLRIDDIASRIALAVAASLGVNLILVTLLLYLGVYSPTNGVLLVTSISIALALLASRGTRGESPVLEAEVEAVSNG